MPNPNPWDGLTETVIGEIKARAKKVWDDNAPARDLIVESAKDLAKLAWDLKLEGDPNQQSVIREEMKIVQQTIENELSALALTASAEAKATFMSIVGTAFGVLVKALPVILAAV